MRDDLPNSTFGYDMPNLRVPDPPSGLTYSEFEDFRYREILKANGIPIEEAELLVALNNERNILQAAAAHTLGRMSSVSAFPTLKTLLTSIEDIVKVEAAYALARNGVNEGKETLVQYLDYPPEAYVFPPKAAGYLAQLGLPQGYKTIVRCMELENVAVRMLACKQIYFFVQFDGLQDAEQNRVDVGLLFERALNDPDTNVQWQALVQLRELQSPKFRKILEQYVERADDATLREFAQAILSGRQKQ